MNDSSLSPASSKPTPKFLTYVEVMKMFRIRADAHRALCEALLQDGILQPETRARILSLTAALSGGSDGS